MSNFARFIKSMKDGSPSVKQTIKNAAREADGATKVEAEVYEGSKSPWTFGQRNIVTRQYKIQERRKAAQIINDWEKENQVTQFSTPEEREAYFAHPYSKAVGAVNSTMNNQVLLDTLESAFLLITTAPKNHPKKSAAFGLIAAAAAMGLVGEDEVNDRLGKSLTQVKYELESAGIDDVPTATQSFNVLTDTRANAGNDEVLKGGARLTNAEPQREQIKPEQSRPQSMSPQAATIAEQRRQQVQQKSLNQGWDYSKKQQLPSPIHSQRQLPQVYPQQQQQRVASAPEVVNKPSLLNNLRQKNLAKSLGIDARNQPYIDARSKLNANSSQQDIDSVEQLGLNIH